MKVCGGFVITVSPIAINSSDIVLLLSPSQLPKLLPHWLDMFAFEKGKDICYLCDLEQLLTRFFFFPKLTFFSNSGELSDEFRVRG
jgi:hypothetical protein